MLSSLLRTSLLPLRFSPSLLRSPSHLHSAMSSYAAPAGAIGEWGDPDGGWAARDGRRDGGEEGRRGGEEEGRRGRGRGGERSKASAALPCSPSISISVRPPFPSSYPCSRLPSAPNLLDGGGCSLPLPLFPLPPKPSGFLFVSPRVSPLPPRISLSCILLSLSPLIPTTPSFPLLSPPLLLS